MTRKDYELIAGCVARSMRVQSIGKRPAAAKAAGERAVSLVAGDLAATLAHDNPRFDKARFLKACGVVA